MSMARKGSLRRRHGNATTADTKARQATFLEAFALYGNIVRACLETDIPRRTVYNWKSVDEKGDPKDSEFMVFYEIARQEAVAVLEAEAWRRAIDGESTPTTVAGERVDVEKKSDTLLIFLIRAHGGPKYRNQHSVDVQAEVALTSQVHLYMPDNGRGPE